MRKKKRWSGSGGFDLYRLLFFLAVLGCVAVFFGVQGGQENDIAGEWIAYDYLLIFLIVWANWFPGRGSCNELGREGYMNSRIGMRADKSNPLFLRGFVRGNRRIGIIAASALKGFYCLQVQAVIKIAVLLVLMCVIGLFRICRGEAALTSAVFSDALLICHGMIAIWMFAGALSIGWLRWYYNHIINKSRAKIYEPMLWEDLFCINEEKQAEFECLTRKNADEKLLFSVCIEYEHYYRDPRHKSKHLDQADSSLFISVCEDRKQYKTRILVQLQTPVFEERHLDIVNDFLREFLERGMQEQELPVMPVCITCVIYVEQISEALKNLVGKVSYENKPACILPVGVVLGEKRIYMPKPGKKNKDYIDMEEDIREILQEATLDVEDDLL